MQLTQVGLNEVQFVLTKYVGERGEEGHPPFSRWLTEQRHDDTGLIDPAINLPWG